MIKGKSDNKGMMSHYLLIFTFDVKMLMRDIQLLVLLYRASAYVDPKLFLHTVILIKHVQGAL